jgi:hypothetical protein
MEIDDTQLEEFIELWVECRSEQYDRVERIGAANDKGRDVHSSINCLISSMDHDSNIFATRNSSAVFVSLIGIDIPAG